MNEPLFLKDTNSNEVIASLQCVNLQCRLENLRERISSEISTLAEGFFEFIVAGTTIKKKQEQKYQVGVCAIRSDDGKMYLDLNCRHPTTMTLSSGSQRPSSSSCEKLTVNADDRDVDKKQNDTKAAKTPRNYPQFYSDLNIEQTTNTLEKDGKIFFNRKLREIIDEGSLHDWGIQAINGVIETHWVLRKTEILKNCVKELIARPRGPTSKDGVAAQEEKQLLKNLDELEKAKFLVDTEHERISSELAIDDKNRKELETAFDQTFTKLKIAQSNLVKSIDHYKDTLSCNQEMITDETDNEATTSADNESEPEDIELSDSETDFLVSSVKNIF